MISKRDLAGNWQNIILSRSDEVPCTELDKELVFLSIENGKYYALKGTARRVWELLSSPTSFDGLMEKLSGEYRIDAERCAIETLPFLEKLVEVGLAKAV
jgi:hypothetical protein